MDQSQPSRSSPKRRSMLDSNQSPPAKRARTDDVTSSDDAASISIHQMLSQQLAQSFINPYRTGQYIQVRDVKLAQPMWLEAEITQCGEDWIFVHYRGFSARYDAKSMFSAHSDQSSLIPLLSPMHLNGQYS